MRTKQFRFTKESILCTSTFFESKQTRAQENAFSSKRTSRWRIDAEYEIRSLQEIAFYLDSILLATTSFSGNVEFLKQKERVFYDVAVIWEKLLGILYALLKLRSAY